jgi:predicted dehydrogenase
VRISDRRDQRQAAARKMFPHIEVTCDECSLTDPGVDIVLIATPVFTHYELAQAALLAGKHVWLEKPMTSNSDQAKELIDLAARKDRILLVDHTFLFTDAVNKMKSIISGGELGEIYYYDSVRVNLGLLQHDVNVIWDLAPHDFSIMDYLLERQPLALCAQGRGHFNTGLEDVAYVTVFYENNLMAHFHLNWLSPVKLRRTMVSGSKKMLVWDDLNAEEKIKIYDKGAEVTTLDGAYGIQAEYRWGDMTSPALPTHEALDLEASYFMKCIEEGKQPHNNGEAGLRIVKLLEATDRSLKEEGRMVEL